MQKCDVDYIFKTGEFKCLHSCLGYLNLVTRILGALMAREIFSILHISRLEFRDNFHYLQVQMRIYKEKICDVNIPFHGQYMIHKYTLAFKHA